jgi:hypothetical protein
MAKLDEQEFSDICVTAREKVGAMNFPDSRVRRAVVEAAVVAHVYRALGAATGTFLFPDVPLADQYVCISEMMGFDGKPWEVTSMSPLTCAIFDAGQWLINRGHKLVD